MKKVFTLLYTVLFFGFGFSQSIIPTPDDSAFVTGNVADEFDLMESHIHVINNYGSAVTFTWGLVDHTAPSASWELKLCDNNNCYDLLLGNNTHESLNVNAGDTMDMKFQFSPHCIGGTADADVAVWVTNDSAATGILLNYKATLTTSCANGIATIGKKSLLLFPNPVKNSFTVSGLENTGNFSFEVFDLKGATMKSKILSATNSQIEISVQHLAAGEYILKAFDQSGNLAGTARMNKID